MMLSLIASYRVLEVLVLFLFLMLSVLEVFNYWSFKKRKEDNYAEFMHFVSSSSSLLFLMKLLLISCSSLLLSYLFPLVFVLSHLFEDDCVGF